MEEKYCIVSKQDRSVQGRMCLQSFARCPLWKSFESIRRQEDTFGWWYLATARYALNKYANKDDYEVLPLGVVEELYNDYVQNK